MEKKKIAFIVRSGKSRGVQKTIALWSKELCKDYEVHVIEIFNSDNKQEYDKSVIRKILKPDIDIEACTKEDNDANAISQMIIQYLKEQQLKVVFVFDNFAMLCTWKLPLQNKGIKFINGIRNSPWDAPESQKRRLKRNLTVSTSMHLLLQCKEQGDYFWWLPFKKKYINNFFEPHEEDIKKHYDTNLRKLISVGYISFEQKNQKILVDALQTLKEKGIYLNLDIYGIGPDFEKLDKYIKEKGLQNQIRLMGEDKKVTQIEKNYDLFVMPSLYEGFPNALLEAAAIGMPCLSSDCRTGSKEIMKDGKTGLLFKNNDVDELVLKLEDLYKNPYKLEKYGMLAKEHVKLNYSKEKVIKQLKDYIEELG